MLRTFVIAHYSIDNGEISLEFRKSRSDIDALKEYVIDQYEFEDDDTQLLVRKSLDKCRDMAQLKKLCTSYEMLVEIDVCP